MEPCDVLETLKKLPPIVFTTDRATGGVIAIKRGVRGYWPIQTRLTSEELNKTKNVTEAQIMAMENGSMFGWEIPAADPDVCQEMINGAKV